MRRAGQDLFRGAGLDDLAVVYDKDLVRFGFIPDKWFELFISLFGTSGATVLSISD